jgi:hypothetical protein
VRHLEATQLVVRTLLRHMRPEDARAAVVELAETADPGLRGDVTAALADATGTIDELTQALEEAKAKAAST